MYLFFQEEALQKLSKASAEKETFLEMIKDLEKKAKENQVVQKEKNEENEKEEEETKTSNSEFETASDGKNMTMN